MPEISARPEPSLIPIARVLRAMQENARQGFYNGSRVPLGYAVKDVERRGHRTKKRLVIDPVEAETVRLIFKLYLRR